MPRRPPLQAQQGVQVEEARVEDQVRAADRVDPDVDTRSDEYRPTTPDDPRDRRPDAYADRDRPDVTTARSPIDEHRRRPRARAGAGRTTDETATVDPAHDQETAPRRTDPA